MGSSPSRGVSPTRASSDEWKRFQVVQAVSTNVGRLIRWGAVVLIFRYGYYSILVLSGRETVASVILRILSNVTVSVSIYIGAALTGVGWGAVERILRKRTVKSLSARIRRLERQIDPNRSSSNLMEDGSTRPEDEED
jgi:hypothetical protein